MEHALISTIIAGLVAAYVFGVAAKILKLPAIFGYLLAGVAVGPYTPGFVADVALAKQLAEIGIILLMFGVGLHFSFRDLLDARKIALPGALAQMLSVTAAGALGAMLLGYQPLQGVIFGFALSVASTIVLLRALDQRQMLESAGGKVAIGWLIIEDIAMVLALVVLPVVAGMLHQTTPLMLSDLAAQVMGVVFKVGGFFAFMLIVGRRVLPWLLVAVARLRSPELNTLGILAVALGFAAMAYLVFDASYALGAFLAGMVLNESKIGHRSAESSLPIRDAFSVLFFVSVGMLFDPMTLMTQPWAVAMTVFLIVVVKGAVALAVLRLFRQPRDISHGVAIGLAQIGEFSFILGSLALSRDLIPQEMYNLILAGAMISIVLNPFLFRFSDRYLKRQLQSVHT